MDRRGIEESAVRGQMGQQTGFIYRKNKKTSEGDMRGRKTEYSDAAIQRMKKKGQAVGSDLLEGMEMYQEEKDIKGAGKGAGNEAGPSTICPKVRTDRPKERIGGEGLLGAKEIGLGSINKMIEYAGPGKDHGESEEHSGLRISHKLTGPESFYIDPRDLHIKGVWKFSTPTVISLPPNQSHTNDTAEGSLY